MNTQIDSPITIVTAQPRPDDSLHGAHHRIQQQRDEPGDRDHEQDVPQLVGELAREVDGDHDAAGGEDRGKRDAARGGAGPDPLVTRGPAPRGGLGLALFHVKSRHVSSEANTRCHRPISGGYSCIAGACWASGRRAAWLEYET